MLVPDAVKAAKSVKNITIAHISTGEVFGDSDVFQGQRYMFTLRSKSVGCRLLTLSKEEFFKILQKFSELKRVLRSKSAQKENELIQSLSAQLLS